jgi:hypothetical protein
VVNEDCGVIVQVPEVLKLIGPSTAKFQVLFPLMAGETENILLVTRLENKPNPLAEAAPKVFGMGIVYLLLELGL